MYYIQEINSHALVKQSADQWRSQQNFGYAPLSSLVPLSPQNPKVESILIPEFRTDNRDRQNYPVKSKSSESRNNERGGNDDSILDQS